MEARDLDNDFAPPRRSGAGCSDQSIGPGTLALGQVDTDGGNESRATPLEEDADLDEYVAASEEAYSMDPRGPSGDLVSDDGADADADDEAAA